MSHSALIEVNDPDSLDRQEIDEVSRQHGYAIVRGVVLPDAISRARTLLKEWFDSSRDRPSRGESPTALQGDFFQKFLLGATHPSGVHRPRCHRTIYMSLDFADRFGLKEVFVALARIRNCLSNLPRDFGIFEDSDGFWTPARVHHYPRGGGFLVEHKDNFTPEVQKSGGVVSYSQPIVVMSRRGTDFSQGGGFVVDRSGSRVHYEEFCDLGDVVLYTGETIHGVDDIDPHLPFEQGSFDGRLSGLVTLYRRAASYGEILRQAGVGDVSFDGREESLVSDA